MGRMPYTGIQPGDIGFDGGVGLSGWLIRRATGAYGHCFIYHKLLSEDGRGGQVWSTVEAGPSGVLVRTRTRPAVKVVRLWRDEAEQAKILWASQACVGNKYGWGEIARLVLHIVGIKVKGTKDNPKRQICSNHVAFAVARMNGSLRLVMPYPPHQIWPQRLAEWCDWMIWTRARATERKSQNKRGGWDRDFR